MCSLGSFLLKFLHSSSLGYYLEQATRSIQLCGVIMEAIQGSHDSPLGKLITPCTLQGSFTSVHCDRYRKGHGRQIEEIQGEGYYSAQMDSKCWQLSSWAPHWMSNQKKKRRKKRLLRKGNIRALVSWKEIAMSEIWEIHKFTSEYQRMEKIDFWDFDIWNSKSWLPIDAERKEGLQTVITECHQTKIHYSPNHI